MIAYYNEYDREAAAVLREAIKRNLIAPGEVDERDIRDVKPSELRRFTQCHFFAGIGIWSYALRMAGWPDNRPVWTGSEPCQPLSAAGKRLGTADERYVRWAWHHLIEHGKRPEVPVYGEQVASKDGLTWLDTLCADMEDTGHSVRAFDLCAAGFGSPQIRQRLFWVADSINARQQGCDRAISGVANDFMLERSQRGSRTRNQPKKSRRFKDSSPLTGFCSAGGLADVESNRRNQGVTESKGQQRRSDIAFCGSTSRMGNTDSNGRTPRLTAASPARHGDTTVATSNHDRPGPTNGFWGTADWLSCRDEKWRPVEPGTFPLADGADCRVGRLRCHGNQIVAQEEIGRASCRERVSSPV